MDNLSSSLNALEEIYTPYIVLIQHPTAYIEGGPSDHAGSDHTSEAFNQRRAHHFHKQGFQRGTNQAIDAAVAAAQDHSLTTDFVRNSTHGSAGDINQPHAAARIQPNPAPEPELFLVLKKCWNRNERLIDLEMVRLQYEPRPNSAGARRRFSYSIINKIVVYRTTSRSRARRLLRRPGVITQLLSEVLGQSDTVHVEPSGDFIYKIIMGSLCPIGCDNGWLPDLATLNCAIPGYKSPAVADHATICPGCLPARLTEHHERLLAIAEDRRQRTSGYSQTHELIGLMLGLNDCLQENAYAPTYWTFANYGLPENAIERVIAVYDANVISNHEQFFWAVDLDGVAGETRQNPACESTIAGLKQVTLGKSQEEQGLCIICTNDFDVGQALTQLGCGHRFCAAAKGCIQEWLRFQKTCPACRKEVD